MTNRMLNIVTALGADAFVVQSMTGREELGRMFEYTLELMSQRADITAEEVLGTNATVSLELNDGQSQRYFNGYVTRFSIYGKAQTSAFGDNAGYLYLVTLHPGAWFLTRAANCQIFSQVAIGELVNTLMSGPGLMKVDNQVSSSEKRDFIVQYRETDFNFVSRMAEHAGIY